jgi:hypothetical protein
MDFKLPNVMRSTVMDALARTTHVTTIVLLPKVGSALNLSVSAIVHNMDIFGRFTPLVRGRVLGQTIYRLLGLSPATPMSSDCPFFDLDPRHLCKP